MNPQAAWQLAQLANQLAAQNRYGGIGAQGIGWGQGGYGFGSPQGQAWGFNRPMW
ncbi:MAG TPA: hypothetical protein VGB82_26855 [Alphaproteobacteria bacterium]